jgi:hypothetical protein
MPTEADNMQYGRQRSSHARPARRTHVRKERMSVTMTMSTSDSDRFDSVGGDFLTLKSAMIKARENSAASRNQRERLVHKSVPGHEGPSQL